MARHVACTACGAGKMSNSPHIRVHYEFSSFCNRCGNFTLHRLAPAPLTLPKTSPFDAGVHVELHYLPDGTAVTRLVDDADSKNA